MNRYLLLKAFEKISLILDCGNACDVHALFPKIKEEDLHNVYVVNLEAIYRFRKGLEETPKWIKGFGIKQIIVTTIHVLFSYDNKIENYNVLEHCWEIMHMISKKCPVYVGIADDKMHKNFARRFANKIQNINGNLNIGYYHTPKYAKH